MFAVFSADELVKTHKMKPTPKWRQQFELYLATMPSYYGGVRAHCSVMFLVLQAALSSNDIHVHKAVDSSNS